MALERHSGTSSGCKMILLLSAAFMHGILALLLGVLVRLASWAHYEFQLLLSSLPNWAFTDIIICLYEICAQPL